MLFCALPMGSHCATAMMNSFCEAQNMAYIKSLWHGIMKYNKHKITTVVLLAHFLLVISWRNPKPTSTFQMTWFVFLVWDVLLLHVFSWTVPSTFKSR